MHTIKQPNHIIFGKNSAEKFEFPKKSLIITSPGSKKRGWIEYLNLKDSYIFDSVEPNPSIERIEQILEEFDSSNFDNIIGVGGGSVLDVAKFVGFKSEKKKIMIPTTFGSGSEVTRISVLKVDGKKTSFHDDNLFSDVAIIDSYFLDDTPFEIIRNSAIDACAQCTEGFDSKLGNNYTKILCRQAFDVLENSLLTKKFEGLAYGSLISGLGFGNCSTTLGHGLSYVFSNEGISHGHALAFTTLVAHKFNNSEFYERFKNLVEKMNFPKISLNQDLDSASELILNDKKHLDNNPKVVSKEQIISLLEEINLLSL